MEKLSSIWNGRNWKITIIKTLVISKTIHILLSLPRPGEEIFNTIEKVFLKFLWQNKPPKFKTSTLEILTALGGLQFPDITKIDMIMKAYICCTIGYLCVYKCKDERFRACASNAFMV